MKCQKTEGGFICFYPSHRLRLEDGGYVFMSWHRYSGPLFFMDRDEQREIEDWYEDDFICDALAWFCGRGERA